MESSVVNLETYRGSLASTSSSDQHYLDSRRHNGNIQFSVSNFIRSPVSALLEYMGILQPQSNSNSDSADSLIGGSNTRNLSTVGADDSDDVSIRIIGSGEHSHDRDGGGGSITEEIVTQNESLVQSISRTVSAATIDTHGDSRSDLGASSRETSDPESRNIDVEAADSVGVNNNRDSLYQRFDIQQAARWAEQVLPFSMILLLIFIRQHLQGFLVTVWIAAFMFKSNDIIRRQTALKGERKISILVIISLLFTLQVAGVYWWFCTNDVLYPLIMLPPKDVPPFWNAIFIVTVNDTLARQAAMVLKCFLLMYYKNIRGKNHRKQGQMLTFVEYLLLLYRAFLPAPVWYRYFLNNEYGSLFSSLLTGLYLTFKLTSTVEKVQSLVYAIKALARKDNHYGVYATSEQVNEAGDLCAICQEKMHAPVALFCKHVFCEECVSEWFERERTCPLCRAIVRPPDLKSFGDGSTSLWFQFF